jgi:tetratricopeptide (TPR) repeat protein
VSDSGPGPVRRRVAIAWAFALGFGAAACALAATAHRLLPEANPLEELAYYPSGNHLRAAVFGHDEAAADLAWLRAVQYYGEHRTTDNRFDRMPHVFDILTTLAPRFVSPHVFGAFAMAQEGGDFAGAERLMKKGIDANPKSGRLAFEMGFLYYVRPGGRDLRHAAEYFEQAARQADAPPASARFAAFAHQHAGDLRVAYELWSAVERESPNRFMREIAERNLEDIRAAIAQGRNDLAVRRLTTPRVMIGGR